MVTMIMMTSNRASQFVTQVSEQSSSQSKKGCLHASGRCNSLVYCVYSIAVLVAILATSHQSAQVMARYLHPAARIYEPFAINSDSFQPRTDNSMRMMRRQDDDDASGDGDDEADFDDQNAAASYRNQDDDSNNQGADGYEDNEADGPYEETPVEREGQADLERFFDDHLGASDREGMDKENLPTNLVASVVKPSTGAPAKDQNSTQAQPLEAINLDWPRALPTAPSDRSSQDSVGQTLAERAALVTVPTDFLETSITRLPDESKLIVTNQITRSKIVGPIGRDKSNGDENNSNSYDDDDGDDNTNANGNGSGKVNGKGNGLDDRHKDYRVRSKSPTAPLAGPAGVLTRSSNIETRGRQVAREQQQQQQQQMQRLPPFLLSIAANQAGRQVERQQQQSAVAAAAALATTTPRDVNNDNLSAISSEVVAIEDDDYDRVYVTNATHKPFRIDALGGYDPEADFRDAARDLEVLSGGLSVGDAAESNAASQQQGRRQIRPSSRAALARDGNLDSGDGDDDGDDEDGDNDRASSNNSGGSPRSASRQLDGNDMYEDASETDEVTFGQDDPYQTDLEAEMRQQSYDKMSDFKDHPSKSNDSAMAAATHGLDDQMGNEDSNMDSYSDVDPEIEDDYKSGGSNGYPRISDRRSDDADDEGSWVNDGVDEMDIPSQSHQNYVLDKAAKHDAMKRKAAEEQQEEAAKNDNQTADEEPHGEDASSDGEVSQRMPNADYLKNDYSDDDSAYAA